jgi:hypothetical protein
MSSQAGSRAPAVLSHSYHPLFPSQHAVVSTGSTDLMYSDHLPIMAKIPFPTIVEMDNPLRTLAAGADSKSVTTQLPRAITVVSWNILENDVFNGFAGPISIRPRREGLIGEVETQEEHNRRMARLTASLELIIKINEPDFIALQEVIALTMKDSLDSFLHGWQTHTSKNSLELLKQYEILSTGSDSAILYRRDRFLAQAADTTLPQQISTLWAPGERAVFRTPEGHIISFLSAHPGYASNPRSHEASIRSILGQHSRAHLSIIAGDFNVHTPPLPPLPGDAHSERNLVTSLTPASFREHVHQGACAIDCVFYSYPNQTSACHQSQICVLDPRSGAESPSVGFPAIPEHESPSAIYMRRELESYRAAVCIDHAYDTIPMFDGLCLGDLRTILETETKSLFYATTCMNKPGLSLIVKCSENAVILASGEFSQSTLVNDPETGEAQNVFVFANAGALLKHALPQPFIEFLETLKELEKEQTPYQKAYRELFVNLAQAYKQKQISLKDVTFITQHFAQLKKKLQDSGMIDVLRDPKKFIKSQQKALGFSKIKRQRILKTIAYGAIGAIVGAIIGAVVGAIIGFGAGGLPGSLLALSAGWSLGTTIAASSTGLGAIGFSACAFWRTKKASVSSAQKISEETLRAIGGSLRPDTE